MSQQRNPLSRRFADVTSHGLDSHEHERCHRKTRRPDNQKDEVPGFVVRQGVDGRYQPGREHEKRPAQQQGDASSCIHGHRIDTISPSALPGGISVSQHGISRGHERRFPDPDADARGKQLFEVDG